VNYAFALDYGNLQNGDLSGNRLEQKTPKQACLYYLPIAASPPYEA
jgi:hypothetical protein